MCLLDRQFSGIWSKAEGSYKFCKPQIEVSVGQVIIMHNMYDLMIQYWEGVLDVIRYAGSLRTSTDLSNIFIAIFAYYSHWTDGMLNSCY